MIFRDVLAALFGRLRRSITHADRDRLDSEAIGGRRVARTSPRRVTRGGFDNRTTWLQRSLQPGTTPLPITLL